MFFVRMASAMRISGPKPTREEPIRNRTLDFVSSLAVGKAVNQQESTEEVTRDHIPPKEFLCQAAAGRYADGERDSRRTSMAGSQRRHLPEAKGLPTRVAALTATARGWRFSKMSRSPSARTMGRSPGVSPRWAES